MVTKSTVVLVTGLLAVSACKPETEGRASLVVGPRILAIRSQPVEAKPGAAVAWDALRVSPDGQSAGVELDWALCLEPKPIAQPGPVALRCLAPSGEALDPLGVGDSVSGTVPQNVCRIFGPTPPEPEPGQPALRPADPDTTGGYYLPVRVLSPGPEYFIGVTRIQCGLGGANQEQAVEYARRTRPNENPALASLHLVRGGTAQEILPGGSAAVSPGETIVLRAAWADCPVEPRCGDGICGDAEDTTNCAEDCAAPVGCTGSEPYLYFDPGTRTLVPRREAIRVSWFATAGEFDHDRTGRAEAEASSPQSENAWTAPDAAGTVKVWVVVRDDRGGVGWGAYEIIVGS